MKLKGKSLNHRPWNGWYFRFLSMAQNTVSFSPLWCFVQSHLWKYMPNLKACCCVFHTVEHTGADLGGGCRGCAPPPPEMTCGFLINTVESASQLYKIFFIIWYVFSAVHIMLLPSRKPSSSYSLLKFVYVTSQLRHSLVVHPLLRKILDPPLHICSI